MAGAAFLCRHLYACIDPLSINKRSLPNKVFLLRTPLILRLPTYVYKLVRHTISSFIAARAAATAIYNAITGSTSSLPPNRSYMFTGPLRIAYADAKTHSCFLTRHVELPTSTNSIPSIQFDHHASRLISRLSAIAPSISPRGKAEFT